MSRRLPLVEGAGVLILAAVLVAGTMAAANVVPS